MLITRAAISYEEQHRQRVRKYLKLMFWRIPAFIGAAVAYGIWHNGFAVAGDFGSLDSTAVDGGADR